MLVIGTEVASSFVGWQFEPQQLLLQGNLCIPEDILNFQKIIFSKNFFSFSFSFWVSKN
jgi:hypothetical protein